MIDADTTGVRKTQNGCYELGEVLGEGGFGVVHRAVMVSTGKEVALKTLRPEILEADTTARARFYREHRIVARLNHPNIVTLLDVSPEGSDELYAAYELLPGRTLADLIKLKGKLSVPKAHHLMIQVLEALAHAHECGVIHRDLKPANIMVVETSATKPLVKVLDFGIATIARNMRGTGEGLGTLTDAQSIPGTPAFMAPEQILYPTGTKASADVYAWGLIFVECLSGIRLARGETDTQKMGLHLDYHIPWALPSELDNHPLLRGVIGKCLEKQKANRYVSALAVLQALEPLTLKSNYYAVVTQTKGYKRARAFLLRRPVLTSQLVVVPLLLLLGIFVYLVSLNGEARDSRELPLGAAPVTPPPFVKANTGPLTPPVAIVDSAPMKAPPLRCVTGKVDVGGACCFPRQVWIVAEGRCVGAPLCPDKHIPRNDDCYELTAREWALERQCRGGNTDACGLLSGRFDPDAHPANKDTGDLALFYFIRGCDAGDRKGCYGAGGLYLKKDDLRLTFDPLSARLYYSKACDLQHASSCTIAGTYYVDHVSVPKQDFGVGLPLLLKGCVLGDDFGCQKLAGIYADPDSNFTDLHNAKVLYGKCAPALKGCVTALENLP